MSQCPSDDPILRRNIFLSRSRLQLWYFLAPIQSFHQHTLFWSRKVHQAVSGVISLLAGRRDDAVDVGTQETIREFRHGVSEIDDCVAGKWLDVAPLCVAAGRKDLEAAEAVEEDCNAAEVSVFTQCDLAVFHGLRWGFDKADLVAGGAGLAVEVLKSLRREAEVVVELFKD